MHILYKIKDKSIIFKYYYTYNNVIFIIKWLFLHLFYLIIICLSTLLSQYNILAKTI